MVLWHALHGSGKLDLDILLINGWLGVLDSQEKAARVLELEGSLALLQAQHAGAAALAASREAHVRAAL